MKEYRERLSRQPKILVGMVVSDIASTKTSHDMRFAQTGNELYHDWWELVQPYIGTGWGVELQPEGNLLQESIWRSFPKMISQNRFLGVHQPNWERNLIDTNTENAKRGLQETCRALDLAEKLGAAYFVVHLLSRDDWQSDRVGQIERGCKVFGMLAEYHRAQRYNTRLCIENLEYPKYPADLEETLGALHRLSGVSENVGLVVDVAHLWHNWVWLMKGIEGHDGMMNQGSFEEVLKEYLHQLSKDYPQVIEGFHIAQGYMIGDTHITHGVPGILEQGEIGRNGLDDLSKPVGFEGSWLDVGKSLAVIREWAVTQQKQDVRIVLEIHNRNPDEMKMVANALEMVWRNI